MFLRATALRKNYIQGIRPVPALKGVDLELAYGEMVCLVGPSGAGKSTLFHTLAGLLNADSGMLSYYKEGALRSAGSLNLGVVFEDKNLFDDFKVKGNFRMQAMMGRLSRMAYRERFELMVKRYGLTNILDEYPDAISEVDRKWVALAKIEMLQPDYYFIEEPTQHMNPNAKHRYLDMIKGLSRVAGVFCLTNDLVCASHADRVIYMTDGALKGELVIDQHALMVEREAQVYSWLKAKGW